MALPTAEQLYEAWRFPSLRHRWLGEPSMAKLEAIVQGAAARAAEPLDEPAALLYELARCQDAYPVGGRATMAVLLVRAQAHAVSASLSADDGQINALRLSIPWERVSYASVRDWFRARLTPYVTPEA